VDSEQLYKKFREKLDYQKIFNEWFERENNGQQATIKKFLNTIQTMLETHNDGDDDSDHSHYMQQADIKHEKPAGDIDGKFLIRNLAIDHRDVNLYKRAMQMEVSDYADILLA